MSDIHARISLVESNVRSDCRYKPNEEAIDHQYLLRVKNVRDNIIKLASLVPVDTRSNDDKNSEYVTMLFNSIYQLPAIPADYR